MSALDKNKKNQPPAPAPQRMICQKGRTIFEQGTVSHQAYILEEGRADVTIEQDGQTIKLGEIGPGEVFGEMGAIDQDARIATVTAAAQCSVIVIPRDDLERRIAAVEDDIVRALINGLIKRLRNSDMAQVRYYQNFAQLQDRLAGMMQKTGQGIDQNRRDEFTAEIVPLLAQVETVLDKYRRPEPDNGS